MSQYFKLVNVSAQEYVSLPGALGARERITTPSGMGMIGFLLLDGPIDGTPLSDIASMDEDRVQDAMRQFKRREKAGERANFRQYMNQEVEYMLSMFAREYDSTPESDPELYEEFCDDRAQSVYRNNDGTWDEKKMFRSALAGFEISEFFEYAGRWAGDEVRLVGDYDDSDLYMESRPVVIVESENGEIIEKKGLPTPIVPESRHRDDIEHSLLDRKLEVGDMVHVKGDDGDRHYGVVEEIRETEWTNITDGLTDEFIDFVGEEWFEKNDTGNLEPDMLVRA